MDLEYLKPLFGHPGPWASVYLDTSRATQDAPKQLDLRLRTVTDALIRQGADRRTTQAVRDRLANEPVSGAPAGRAVFASGGEVVMDIPLACAPITPDTSWSELPHLVPLLTLRGDDPLCLVARIDAQGADLELRDLHGREPLGQAEGRQWQGRGHRGVPTDRAEWHYRNKVEEGWNETAELIAKQITQEVADSGARLVVLTGEPRERKAVHARLPEQLQSVTVEAEAGGRAAGLDREQLDRQIAEACQSHARKRLEAALDHFHAGRGRPGEHGPRGVDTPPGEAVEGVPAVVEAARSHQMATLLLGSEGPDPGRDIWIGPGVDDLGVQRSQVQVMGVSKPGKGRADDALLRSAVATGAEVMLVPEGIAGPAGGVGAVLRWS